MNEDAKSVRNDTKNFEFLKFEMADGLASKRCERICYGLLIGARFIVSSHRGDTLGDQ